MLNHITAGLSLLSQIHQVVLTRLGRILITTASVVRGMAINPTGFMAIALLQPVVDTTKGTHLSIPMPKQAEGVGVAIDLPSKPRLFLRKYFAQATINLKIK